MKKNKMMRTGSVLLVLCLLTTCVISGTFAKYITADEGSDTARVAKWGIVATVSGNLFGEKYYVHSAGSDAADQISVAALDNSVKSSGEVNSISDIVAPGTKSDTGLSLAITGTPEVSYKVEVSKNSTTTMNGNNEEVVSYDLEDIWLNASKTYGVLVPVSNVTEDNFESGKYYYATADGYALADKYSENGNAGNVWYVLNDVTGDITKISDSSNIVNNRYYPITWTVSGTNDVDTDKNYYTVESMYNALDNYFKGSVDVDADSATIDKAADINWEWNFREDSMSKADASNGADTILGNLIALEGDANNSLTYVVVTVSEDRDTCEKISADDYNLETEFDISLTVTQVD